LRKTVLGEMESQMRRYYDLCLSVLGLLILLYVGSACTGEVTVTYDPATGKATATGKVSGKSKKITLDGLGPGTHTVNDPDCGLITITIDPTCTSPVTTTIECGDPILAEIPYGWTFLSGTYSTASGKSGNMIVHEISDFSGIQGCGSVVTSQGYRAVVVEADSLFPFGDTLNYVLQFDTHGQDACGKTLKGIEVAIVTSYGNSGVTQCGLPVIQPCCGEPCPDFPAISDPAHVIYICAVPYDAPSLGTFGIIGLILILVLAGVVVLRKRRLQRAG
jgi:hypothetical protein